MSLKETLKKIPLLQRWGRKARYVVEYALWLLKGRPAPAPQLYKIKTVKRYARLGATTTFVETGTLYGETTAAVSPLFEKCLTIELDDTLFTMATRRFADSAKIEVIHGDSGKKIPEVLARLSTPALFWLDGHFSGGVTAKGEKETPVFEELEAILAHPVKNHVILVDDARCFGHDTDYPTLEEVEALLKKSGTSYRMSVADDIIRIHV